LVNKFGSDALSLVLHFKNSCVTPHKQANLGGWAVGMTVNIGKRLLQNSEQRRFQFAPQARELSITFVCDGYVTARAKAIEIPLYGR
jgi:DhnA family fructose-bisphosphate aldolase class Ia